LPRTDAPLIRARRAVFGYGGRPVVSDVDLEIYPGLLLGLAGPNGAGKTTLFRGLLGLLPPMGGSVQRSTEAIGYVPQREVLDPVFPLTVEEVVQMGAYGRLRGLRRLAAADRELALLSLRRVGLADHRRDLFSSLSGGQRQRVLIARALMMRPAVLLLDEPTSGVDRPAQRLIFDLLRRLHRDEGLAVLLVSHELGMLREAVDEVLWVSGGRVERGSASQMLSPRRLDRLFSAGAAGGPD